METPWKKKFAEIFSKAFLIFKKLFGQTIQDFFPLKKGSFNP
jgi:hypothetical protein